MVIVCVYCGKHLLASQRHSVATDQDVAHALLYRHSQNKALLKNAEHVCRDCRRRPPTYQCGPQVSYTHMNKLRRMKE